MRKMLVAAAMCVASVGAWAQGYSFSLLSSVTNTVVGGGVINYTASPGFTIAGDQTLFNTPDFSFTISGMTIGPYALTLTTAVIRLLDGQPAAVEAFYDNDIGKMQEVFYLRGTTFRQDSYPLGGPPYSAPPYVDNGTIVFAQAIPEPGTYAFLLGGLALIAATRRHRAAPAGGN